MTTASGVDPVSRDVTTAAAGIYPASGRDGCHAEHGTHSGKTLSEGMGFPPQTTTKWERAIPIGAAETGATEAGVIGIGVDADAVEAAASQGGETGEDIAAWRTGELQRSSTNRDLRHNPTR